MARSSSSAGFQADIVSWVSKIGVDLDSIPGRAAILMVEDARLPQKQGGNMPVVTGNLRNSVAVSFSEIPQTDMIIDQMTKLTDPTASINSTLASAKVGQKIGIGFRAPYAIEVEQKYGFVRLAAQKWDQYVAAVVKQIKGSS